MTKTTETRTRAEAKKLMWEYYRDNKASLPRWIGECREEILGDLQLGFTAENVFSDQIESVLRDTAQVA